MSLLEHANVCLCEGDFCGAAYLYFYDVDHSVQCCTSVIMSNVFFVFAGNNLQKACAAVGSYLLLRPEDETMLTNKNFYLQQAGISEEDFQPRKVTI